MKITVLMENTGSRADLFIEHGLSLYIETEKHCILFDTGQSGRFADNALTLGIDLEGVDTAFLSHGHYDHGGGLRTFLSVNRHAPVYLQRGAFGEYYHGPEKYIGLDRRLQGEKQLKEVDGGLVLDEELSLVTLPDGGLRSPVESYGLQKKTGGRLVEDKFLHEQYLLIREKGKTVLFSGCSHRGICNIASAFPADVVVGGFHFTKLDPEGEGREKLETAAETLLRLPGNFMTCHCTGGAQYRFLRERMGSRLQYLSTGDTVEI